MGTLSRWSKVTMVFVLALLLSFSTFGLCYADGTGTGGAGDGEGGTSNIPGSAIGVKVKNSLKKDINFKLDTWWKVGGPKKGPINGGGVNNTASYYYAYKAKDTDKKKVRTDDDWAKTNWLGSEENKNTFNGITMDYNSAANWGWRNNGKYEPACDSIHNLSKELEDVTKNGNKKLEIKNHVPFVKGSSKSVFTAIWIVDDWRKKISSEKKTIIYYVSSDEEPGKIDETSKVKSKKQSDLKWLYENGSIESSYSGKSLPNEGRVTSSPGTKIDTVTAKFLTIEKEYTYELCEAGINKGKKRNEKTTYKIVSNKTHTRDINLNTQMDPMTQEYYKPYHLNTESVATTDYIKSHISSDQGASDIANASKTVDITVKNGRNGNQSEDPMEMTDTNSDKWFSVKFNNNVFGLDPSYNWKESAKSLGSSYGGTPYENAGSDYCNNYADSGDSDGITRSDLTLSTTVSGVKGSSEANNSKYKTSQLLHESDLNNKDDVENKLFDSDGTTFKGGDFFVRAIVQGKFNLSNRFDVYKDWWVAKYKQTRYYEYGVEYSGKITTTDYIGAATATNSINKTDEDPWKNTNTTTSTTVIPKSATNFTVDVNNKQRGLYIGADSKVFYNPLLAADFNVKTIAGDQI